ncbi:DUF5335 family protein [Nordella sp. HKS 07]|uniref:DUF5335 family protein n=1 Tax=Nordella sp. HKS 07 TaxID=2712222 RepID=UPI0019D15645|nr:DUF5335 family protein [Nordella sp. HKS 07]
MAEISRPGLQGLAGKQVEIEVAALGLGDQILTQWVPVLGLVYEPKSNSVEIAVEGLDHMIRDPKAVYAEQDRGEVTSIEIIDKDDVRQILKFRDTLLLPAP